jgi:hypothetical protein
MNVLNLSPARRVAASLGEGLVEEDESVPGARASGDLGSRPLVVLTAGRGFSFDDPVPAKEAAGRHEVWTNEMQPQLARLSTRGRQLVVEGSGHAIQYEDGRPEPEPLSHP